MKRQKATRAHTSTEKQSRSDAGSVTGQRIGKANQAVFHKCLQMTVVLGAILLVLSTWMGSTDVDRDRADTPLERGAERNERSTPRAFILPATPGVAFEQERQILETTRQAQIVTCLGMLRSHGFHIDDAETLLNAKHIEAIYTFQIDRGLPASGQLDEVTMRELACD